MTIDQIGNKQVPAWEIGPKQPRLQPGAVHLWLIDCRLWVPSGLEPILSDPEYEQAKRFHWIEDRNRFIIRHTFLRQLLANYLACDPAVIRIGHGEAGKPALLPMAGKSPIYFNISKSRDFCLFALASDREVGIDLEYMNEEVEIAPLAARLLSPREASFLESSRPETQHSTFYSLWTGKEACVKCTGEGLTAELREIETTLPVLKSQSMAGRYATQWSISWLFPAPGYAAALAVHGSMPQIACWRIGDEWVTPN